MDTKANPAPSIDARPAIKNPGQIPYVNPIKVIDPAKPNSGGWDASTDSSFSSVTQKWSWWYAPTKRPQRNIPGTPIPFILIASALNHCPILVGVMMITSSRTKMCNPVMILGEVSFNAEYAVCHMKFDSPYCPLRRRVSLPVTHV